jgi:hypothetical protein
MAPLRGRLSVIVSTHYRAPRETSFLYFTFALALERASFLYFTFALAQGVPANVNDYHSHLG